MDANEIYDLQPLIDARDQRGLSNAEIALRGDLSKPTVIGFFRSGSSRIRTWRKIAEALNVNLNDCRKATAAER